MVGTRVPSQRSGGVSSELPRRPLGAGFPGPPSAPPPRATSTAVASSASTGDGWLCSAGMTELTAMTATQATGRLADWQTALRAENKSPGTVAVYGDGATRYLRWCTDRDYLPMSRAALNQWIAGLLEAGAAPGTARIRQLAVRRFASWLAAGREITADPFPGVKAPRVVPPLVEPLTDDELRALVGTCAVSEADAQVGETLHHRRDEAIIRLMVETAIRSGEVVDLQLDDVDLIGRLITVRRGKGGRGRVIPIGQTTTEAILVYLDDREKHPLLTRPTCGWAAAASGSAAKDSSARYAAAPCAPESTASGPTGSGTPPPTAGSPPAAPSPGSWPSPAGPAPTCSSATPEPVPPNAPQKRRDGSTSASCDLGPRDPNEKDRPQQV
jgi:site-specific recombinase XerD